MKKEKKKRSILSSFSSAGKATEREGEGQDPQCHWGEEEEEIKGLASDDPQESVSTPKTSDKSSYGGSTHGGTPKWLVYNGKSYLDFRKPPYSSVIPHNMIINDTTPHLQTHPSRDRPLVQVKKSCSAVSLAAPVSTFKGDRWPFIKYVCFVRVRCDVLNIPGNGV